MNICFTGPRRVTSHQAQIVLRKLSELNARTYHVGCASGVDAIIRQHLQAIVYHTEGWQPWQLAARSKRMVDSCFWLGDARLVAFPNKPCPEGVRPSSTFRGNGSGTWGTIAYAFYLGMDVEVVSLVENFSTPDWMNQRQLVFF